MRIGVIADDLTGANGTGVMLAKLGLDCYTAFNREVEQTKEAKTAMCIDTDSRYAAGDEAKEKVEEAYFFLADNWQADIICKRIDSTFRGNIGHEVEALLHCATDDLVAVIVPTYPSSNRIVINSQLYVNNTLLHETDVANDPVQPMTDANILTILRKQTNVSSAAITIETIRTGPDAIRRQMEQLRQENVRIIVCDAVTEEDVQHISEAMTLSSDHSFLPVDPGPLTYYYVQQRTHMRSKRAKRVLATVGSITSLTAKQIRYVQEHMDTETIYVDAKELVLTDSRSKEEKQRVVNQVLSSEIKAKVILITTNNERAERVDFSHLAKEEGCTEEVLSKRLTDGLAHIAKQLLTASEDAFDGCYFSGGDVSASFMKASKAHAIKLIDEVIPIVAYGTVVGGAFNNLPVITKGGLIGTELTMYDCITYLQYSEEER